MSNETQVPISDLTRMSNDLTNITTNNINVLKTLLSTTLIMKTDHHSNSLRKFEKKNKDWMQTMLLLL